MTFDDFDDLLADAGFEGGASETHGMLCGRLAGGQRFSPAELQSVMVEWFGTGAPVSGAIEDRLVELYRDVLAGLEDPDLGFRLLLPDDEVALRHRVRALAEWSAGFLVGLGESGIPDAGLSPESTEVIEDLAAISRAFCESEVEEDEQNFASLEEYVRVAAMLLFTDINKASPPPAETLH